MLGIVLALHDARSRLVTGIVAGWATLHVVAYSVTSLGAPYPWYTAMPLPLLALTAGCAVAWVVERVRLRERRWSVVPIAALSGLVLWSSIVNVRVALRPRDPLGWELFEADRRAAGRFLREHAGPGEVLECAYGWPAFISRLPVNDRARLNSSRFLEPVTYRVEHGEPSRGAPVPAAPHGMVPLATFDSARRRFSEYGAFVVFGLPASAAATALPND
jgi:hypothetical protein